MAQRRRKVAEGGDNEGTTSSLAVIFNRYRHRPPSSDTLVFPQPFLKRVALCCHSLIWSHETGIFAVVCSCTAKLIIFLDLSQGQGTVEGSY